jgi:hypothetical protein
MCSRRHLPTCLRPHQLLLAWQLLLLLLLLRTQACCCVEP